MKIRTDVKAGNGARSNNNFHLTIDGTLDP